MGEAARTFEDLRVWRRAHEFVLDIYRYPQGFPAEERFVLTSQMRRAAVSVPANIAEGYSKRGKSDKVRFFSISQGSLEEVHYYLILANDLGYGEPAQLLTSCDEVGWMLQACCSAVRHSNFQLPASSS